MPKTNKLKVPAIIRKSPPDPIVSTNKSAREKNIERPSTRGRTIPIRIAEMLYRHRKRMFDRQFEH
ncbi:putative 1-phosphatidylinositol-4,5-bisphosphate phosphodiesterase [Ruegeria lacuscaerulensis ITI-1157]|nr:putative 1-phosphatidylinositol-4,5-bisphosphate phosphodiesterase [Ruegeria lacuscaerulensis ITI-1157]